MEAFVRVLVDAEILSEEDILECLDRVNNKIRRVPFEAIDAVMTYRIISTRAPEHGGEQYIDIGGDL